MTEKRTIILLSLAILLLFAGIFDHSLWTSDEPRVAEIAREMAVTGDHLIPKLSGKPFLEQPPLYYAVAGVFWRIFGTGNEGFGRLSSVLFAAGTLFVIFFGTRALYGEHIAAFSALILATTEQFFMISHKMVVDNALAFFITGALFSFLLAYQQILKSGYVIFWICLAGAFLTKGIVGLAIPGVAVVLFALWQRDFSVIRKAWVIPGILIVSAVILAWAWVLYFHGGKEFLYTFFLYNNLGRFLHVGIYEGGHVRPFYYYIPTVLLDGAPWSLLFIPALIASLKLDERLRFFCSWFFGGLILLTLASTKRGLYFLPMYPAMTVIVGQWMYRLVSEGSSQWEKGFLRAIFVLLTIIALLVPAGYVKIGGSIPLAALGFLLSTGLLWLIYSMITSSLPEWLPVGFAILILTWTPLFFPQIDTLKTYKPFFREAGRIIGQDKVIGNNLTETVEAFSPFYGGFTVETVSDKKSFEQMILSKAAQYAIILPDRSDENLLKLLGSQGEKVLEVGSRERRYTQLWRLSKLTGGNAKEAK
jgi:4-amino-4-deoxy-L-arabinose transferase-like glycosyltransferase